MALDYKLHNAKDLIENIKNNISKYPAQFKGADIYVARYEVITFITVINGKTANVKTG